MIRQTAEDRAEAHALLDAARAGVPTAEEAITVALCTTGDMQGFSLFADTDSPTAVHHAMTFPHASSVKPSDDLRALMQKHELTQRDVAELACVSIKTVESWLADAESSNHRNMPGRNMRAIRFALPAHLAAKRGRKA